MIAVWCSGFLVGLGVGIVIMAMLDLYGMQKP